MQSKRLMAAFFAVALFIAGIAGSASALPLGQLGLVNVSVGDVEVLTDNQIAAAVPIVANLCPNVNLNVILAALLAVAGGDSDQKTMCHAVGGPVIIHQ
jgi:hypothetical protein